MKLYYNPASPFVAKTRIIAHECGLSDKIELIEIALAPGNPDHAFSKQNPLRQIPTLITNEGTHIFDSFVICDYLISLSNQETLLPSSGWQRSSILQVHALLNGMTERAVGTRYETFARPEEYRWPAMVDDNLDRIEKGLAFLANDGETMLAGPFDISKAAFVALMRYLDFRFADIGWREKHPALVAPFEALNELSSVKHAYDE